MELELKRDTRTELSTTGILKVNGVVQCFVLEDKDRGLTQNMTLRTLLARKVYGSTAIPAGRYEVIINYSNRFKQYMPLLLNVPGYAGVRIHPGNVAADTEGCLLVGETRKPDFVGNSRIAYRLLLAKMQQVEKKEKIFITIS